jgi:hypothetical protein
MQNFDNNRPSTEELRFRRVGLNMSPNTISSNETSSHHLSTTEIFNDIHLNSAKAAEKRISEIVITKHLCEPCPGSYTDIFNKVLIICRDPSHTKSCRNRVE